MMPNAAPSNNSEHASGRWNHRLLKTIDHSLIQAGSAPTSIRYRSVFILLFSLVSIAISLGYIGEITGEKISSFINLPPSLPRKLVSTESLLLTANQPQTASASTKMRILYIVTTSQKDRITDIVLPVIKTAVESLVEDYHVDVFLISNYTLSSEKQEMISKELPNSVKLEVWDDAAPMIYNSRRDQDRIIPGGAQLARQHRFVVKEKLPYYDFFMAFEDDMLVTKHHVENHMSAMSELRKLKEKADAEIVPTNNLFWGPLSKKQLERMRPGFLRVEALQSNNDRRMQPNLHPIPVDLNFTFASGNRSSYHATVDPKACCYSPYILPPKSDDLLLWEAGILGTFVREMPESSSLSWVALLPASPTSRGKVNGFWPGQYMNASASPPPFGNPKLMAQSAGWMGSRQEVMELHELCKGGFFPPFDPPYFPSDGLAGKNVEFWSGGLQLWGNLCHIQRFISLDPHRFSLQLMYHISNNKQRKIQKKRLVRVNHLLGQLNSVQKYAEAIKYEDGSSKRRRAIFFSFAASWTNK
jgi:hypothetical protein